MKFQKREVRVIIISKYFSNNANNNGTGGKRWTGPIATH